MERINEQNPNNCCMTCGKKLIACVEREMIVKPPIIYPRPVGKITNIIGFGYQRNNFFCSLTCGFRWAVSKLKAIKK